LRPEADRGTLVVVELPFAELVRGLAALRVTARAAGGGSATLNALLQLARRVLGAHGVAICELTGPVEKRSGRVVATAGSAGRARGRPVPPQLIRQACLPGEQVYRLELNQVDEESAELLADLGSSWILVHRTEVAGRPVALLSAFMPADVEFSADHRAAMSLIGVAANHLYAVDVALPITDPPGAGRDNQADHELFIAVTSHELRTPVTVIKGYADTLRDHWDSLDERDRRDAARVIGQRSDELARLVDRLLAANTTGSARLQLGQFDLLAALRQAAIQLPADLRRNLLLDLPSQLPTARGDRRSVANVLTELVTNAHKYSSGKSTIRVTAGADRRTVLFQVADRGIGIPPDHVDQVFERFWQAETGDERRWGGAGLGLYLVRKTIERQNGWVSLRPRDGGGTVAEVRLPRGDVGRDAAVSGEA
jgi:two-component system, OmpR family, phosphate regulon sensor histidine kinase PhoR